MIDHQPPRPQSLDSLLASLRCTVHRMEQSENPSAVAFIKQLLLERIGELEAEATRQSPDDSESRP